MPKQEGEASKVKEKVVKMPEEKKAIKLMRHAQKQTDIERTKEEQALVDKFDADKATHVAELLDVIKWIIED